MATGAASRYSDSAPGRVIAKGSSRYGMLRLIASFRLTLGSLSVFVLVLALAAGPARAQTADAPASGVVAMAPIRSAGDGPAPGIGGVLSATDKVLFVEAQDSADRRDWVTARRLAAQGSNALALEIIEWRFVSDERSGASFQEISGFLGRHPGWPRQAAILALAEKAIPATLDPYQVIGWFGERAPVSGVGGLRLGEALIAAGRNAEGNAVVRKAWTENTFSAAEENQILGTHGAVFSEEDQRARLLELLARDSLADARRQVPRVDSQTQRLADARLRLKTTPASAARLPDTLEPALRADPWLIFDQARAFRRSGNDEDAWAVMQLSPPQIDLVPSPERWWAERHIMARDALKAHQFDVAYRFASEHHLQSGASLADAEFLAGWIALRFLNKPDIALKHFQTLAGGVSLPISRARANYWIGRAEEALGEADAAGASYAKAAEDTTTYYGQLAMARLTDRPVLRINAAMPDGETARATLAADERFQAMQVLVDVNEPFLLRTFAMQTAGDGTEPARLRFLADFMAGAGDRTAALRIAKVASYNGVLMLPYLDPLIELPAVRRGAEVDPALVLGLTRQESEFDPAVVSSAGARGLMQLMPATARQTASAAGLAYRLNNLTDPVYNMQLGIAHLSDLLNRWDGSYVLTIASYNAGAANVSNWVATYGDPRDPEVDTIDWIELIPFGETRNYVQRVLENTQVYRNRLAGSDQNLMIIADLSRSHAPPPPGIPVPQQAPDR